MYYRDHFLGDRPVRLSHVEEAILLATVAVKEIDETMRFYFRGRMKEQKVQLGIIANFHYEKLNVVFERV